MKYDAFISYRHGGIDQEVAQVLHKQLEGFKIPKSAIGKGNGKTRIERVFRDEEELPLSSDLEESIKEALAESEWLILICTPRLKESQWCMKEIDYFIEFHGQDHILAVLVEGEPHDVFPEQLLKRKVKTIDSLGRPIEIYEDIEPMAADVRVGSQSHVKKLIEKERLRILAPILELDYDDLKRRERERRLKRTLVIAGVVVALSVAFTVFSTFMFIKISDQKAEIELKAAEIEEQNETILAINEEIEKQNETLRYNQAVSIGKEAYDLLVNDRKDLALPLAYESLTKVDDIEMTYNSYGELALSAAMGIYDHSMKHLSVQDVFPIEGVATDFDVTDDYRYIAVVVEKEGLEYEIDVIDSYTKEVLHSIPFSDYDSSVYFVTNDTIAIVGYELMDIYKLNSRQADLIYEVSIGGDSSFVVLPDSNRVLNVSENLVVSLDLDTGDYFTVGSPDNKDIISGASYDGSYLVELNNENKEIIKYSASDRSEIGRCVLPEDIDIDTYDTVGLLTVDYGPYTAYLYSYLPEEYLDNPLTETMKTLCFCINNEDGSIVWTKTVEGAIKDLKPFNDDSRIIGCAGMNLYIIDVPSGAVEDLWFDSYCVSYTVNVDSNNTNYVAFYSDLGTYSLWTENAGLYTLVDSGFDYNRTVMNKLIFSYGPLGRSLFILPQNGEAIYVYSPGANIGTNEIDYSEVDSGKRSGLLSINSGEIQRLLEGYNVPDVYSANHLLVIDECGESGVIVATSSDKLFVLDVETKEVIYSLDSFNALAFYLSENYAFDEEGNLIVFCSGNALLFNSDYELIGLCYGAEDFDVGRQEIVYKYASNAWYAGPVWTLDELLEEASERLEKID